MQKDSLACHSFLFECIKYFTVNLSLAVYRLRSFQNDVLVSDWLGEIPLLAMQAGFTGWLSYLTNWFYDFSDCERRAPSY